MPHRTTSQYVSPALTTDTYVLVGQLTELTRATSDGLKALGEEVKRHGGELITVGEGVRAAEEQLDVLDRLVRTGSTGNHSVIFRLAVLEEAVVLINSRLKGHDEAKTENEKSRLMFLGARTGMVVVISVIAQIVTLLIAAYAAKGGK